jgi:hypothetical protein
VTLPQGEDAVGGIIREIYKIFKEAIPGLLILV